MYAGTEKINIFNVLVFSRQFAVILEVILDYNLLCLKGFVFF